MRVWLFRFIALTIPILFFVFLELGLRVANYGHEYPLFIDNPDAPDYILPRPDVVKRYFAESGDVPTITIEANFMRKTKPKDSLRFVVQGGSSAAGFPYGLSASIAGMLDHRLKQTFPNRYVEVVNTALAAVNSYTVLDLTDEIIQQAPDAVLLYMGHNEFLGILGVGSNYTAANSQSTTLLFLKLKDLRLFQLLQNLYQMLTSSQLDPDFSEQADYGSRTFMAKVAKHKNIPLDSDLFYAGSEQFETNLSLILAKYKGAGIPVYISTLTSNLLDQAPFSSAEISPAVVAQMSQIQQQLLSGQADSKLIQQAEVAINASDNAHAHFQLGRIFYQLGNQQKAKQHLTLAKDLDLLRFRAPESFNRIIRKQAAQYNAFVVESQSRFEQRSRLGIVGNNLMLEHLHPNVQGYFLLSDAFYQSIKQSAQFNDWHNVETAEAWKQRPLLPPEEYFGFAKVLQLKTDYPFVDKRIPLNLPEPNGWEQQLGYDLFMKKRDWISMAYNALQQYQVNGDSAQALKTQLLIADAIPYNIEVNQIAAKMLIRQQDFARATTYLQRAIWAGDSSADTQARLASAKQKLN